MTPGIRPLVAGNWKMNGTSESLAELRSIGHALLGGVSAEADALICVPATLLSRAADVLANSPVKAGGEDCHAAASGAHTGDISAEMLKDAGATHVIVGHSERRTDHGETDAIVQAKAEAAWRAGLVAIVCTTLYFPVVQECEQGVSRWIDIPSSEGHSGHGPGSKTPAPGLKLTTKP